MTKIIKRFTLLTGKYGHYFYDNAIKLDLTTKMVLDKLNYSEKLREQNNFLINEINQMKLELIKLRTIMNEVI